MFISFFLYFIIIIILIFEAYTTFGFILEPAGSVYVPKDHTKGKLGPVIFSLSIRKDLIKPAIA